ncbi:uncharacterized protein YMR317W-like [Xenopus tropicalis]|uniref:Uncharacterized protein YMR317W-like n=1 Tax=Xenopus tropicalis TaxID=8364 RepID=A0A8J1IPN2_XENTR|nr:uncharacterized protein YMR317W-like [Xenopus tropicalis]
MKSSRMNLLTYLGLFIIIADCQVKGLTVGGILNTISNILWPSSTKPPTTLLTTSDPTKVSITDMLSLDTNSNSVTDSPKVTLFMIGTGDQSYTSSFTEQLMTSTFTQLKSYATIGPTKASSTDATVHSALTSSSITSFITKNPILLSSASNTATTSFMETSNQPSPSSRGVTSGILYPVYSAQSSFTPSNDNILTIPSARTGLSVKSMSTKSLGNGITAESTNSVLRSSRSSTYPELTKNIATSPSNGINVITSTVASTMHSPSTSSTVASLNTDPNTQIKSFSTTAKFFSKPESGVTTIPSSIIVTNTAPQLSRSPIIYLSPVTSIQHRPSSTISSLNTENITGREKIRNSMSSYNSKTNFQHELSSSALTSSNLGANIQSEKNKGDIPYFTTGTSVQTEPTRGDLSSSETIPNMLYESATGTLTSNRNSFHPVSPKSTAIPVNNFTSLHPELSKSNVTSSTSVSSIQTKITRTTFISSSANIKPKLTKSSMIPSSISEIYHNTMTFNSSETSNEPDLSSEMYSDTGTDTIPVTSSKIRISNLPISPSRVKSSSTSNISNNNKLTLTSPVTSANIQFRSNGTVTSFKPDVSSTSVIYFSAETSKPSYRIGSISTTTSTGINIGSKLSNGSVPYSSAVTRFHSKAYSPSITVSMQGISSTKQMESSFTGISIRDQLTGTVTSGKTIQQNPPLSKFASPITWASKQTKSSFNVPFTFTETNTKFEPSSGIRTHPETSSSITPFYSIWNNNDPLATKNNIVSNTEPRIQSELLTSTGTLSSANTSMQPKAVSSTLSSSSSGTNVQFETSSGALDSPSSVSKMQSEVYISATSIHPKTLSSMKSSSSTLTNIQPELPESTKSSFTVESIIKSELTKSTISPNTKINFKPKATLPSIWNIQSSRSLITIHPKLNSNTPAKSLSSIGISTQLLSSSDSLTPSSFGTNILSENVRSDIATSIFGHRIQPEPDSSTKNLYSVGVSNKPESLYTALFSTKSGSRKITSSPAKSTQQYYRTEISTYNGSSSSLLRTSNPNIALESFSAGVSKQSKTDSSSAIISVPATNHQRRSTIGATTFFNNRTKFQFASLSSTVIPSSTRASNQPNSHSNGVTSYIGSSSHVNFYSTKNYSATVDRGINGQTAAATETDNVLLAWQIILISLAAGLATFTLVGGTFLVNSMAAEPVSYFNSLALGIDFGSWLTKYAHSF